jgi:hypothetical protein
MPRYTLKATWTVKNKHVKPTGLPLRHNSSRRLSDKIRHKKSGGKIRVVFFNYPREIIFFLSRPTQGEDAIYFHDEKHFRSRLPPTFPCANYTGLMDTRSKIFLNTTEIVVGLTRICEVFTGVFPLTTACRHTKYAGLIEIHTTCCASFVWILTEFKPCRCSTACISS